MSSIVMIAHGRDPYDHTEEIQYTFYQIDEVDLANAKITGQRNIKDRARTGWYSVTVLDTKTQRATPIFYAENPLLERLELNPAAKKAKVGQKSISGGWDDAISQHNLSSLISALNVAPPPPSTWPHTEAVQYTELEF